MHQLELQSGGGLAVPEILVEREQTGAVTSVTAGDTCQCVVTSGSMAAARAPLAAGTGQVLSSWCSIDKQSLE